jgi:hypothetical protein
MTFKDETQVQANVGRVGIREGTESGWSWGFGLNGLGVFDKNVNDELTFD